MLFRSDQQGRQGLGLRWLPLRLWHQQGRWDQRDRQGLGLRWLLSHLWHQQGQESPEDQLGRSDHQDQDNPEDQLGRSDPFQDRETDMDQDTVPNMAEPEVR